VGVMRKNDQEAALPAGLQSGAEHWQQLTTNVAAWNTGQYSLYDAITHQNGQVGRLWWGGVLPAMAEIYQSLPPKTKVWSFYNRSYCLLPVCDARQFFSQITSKRWYDIALGSIDEGKQILQADGTNFFLYSTYVPKVLGADSNDQLAVFYDGFAPEHIADTFGIVWTNGKEYLLTWKEGSIAPLDARFMESWRQYYAESITSTIKVGPVRMSAKELAKFVKNAVSDPSLKHPPLPMSGGDAAPPSP
jgi:hypothetical protein